MLYLQNENILFLRLPKTGSTAMANFLIENFSNIKLSWFYYKNKDLTNLDKPHVDKKLSHMTLQYIWDNNIIDKDKLSKARIIAVVRNPGHRLLSLYNSRNRNKSQKDFLKRLIVGNGWILDYNKSQLTPYRDYVTIDDKIPDNVELWPFEFIDELAKTLKSDVPLKKANVSSDKLRNSVITDNARKFITKTHAADYILYHEAHIRFLKYKYP